MSTESADAPSENRLTVGELFPQHDVVGQWVFSLTALAEDLNVGLQPSKDALATGDLRALLFWHRHLVTRLFEARRLVTTARNNPEIAEFASDLLQKPPAGVSLFEAYTRPSRDTPSSVEAMYEDIRHLSVHYAKVGKPELEDALATHAYLPAEMKLTIAADGIPDLTFGWVQAIRSMEVLGDIRQADFLEKLRAESAVTASLAAGWLMVTALAIALHVRRVGIDANRLGDLSSWHPPASLIPPRTRSRSEIEMP